MRPEISVNFDPILKERERIKGALKVLKKQLRELESPHSFASLTGEEFAKREAEISQVQAQIDFLTSGNKQLKDKHNQILEQSRGLKKEQLIN